jgi:hypothetical protein
MAKKRRSGYSFVGKEVQSSEFRIDKDLYIQKGRSPAYQNNVTTDINGKTLTAPVALKHDTLDDDAAAMPIDLFTGNILQITPTASRSKATPTASALISKWGLTDRFQYVDVCFINLTASTYYLAVVGGTDVTIVGDPRVLAATSGLFRFIVTDVGISVLAAYRLA